MEIGNSVYFVTDHKTTGGGVPAIVCSLQERSARIAIEREEGTKTMVVPLWDLLPARVHRGNPASLLRRLGNLGRPRANSRDRPRG